MKIKLYKIVSLGVLMVLDGCSGYKSYMGEQPKGRGNKFKKITVNQLKIQKEKREETQEIKSRRDVVNLFNERLQNSKNSKKYGVALPKLYADFLIYTKLPSNLIVGDYEFFGLRTAYLDDAKKGGKCLIRKQNSYRSFYLLNLTKPVKERKSKSTITKCYLIQKPFFIATAIDGSCGFFIDLIGEKNGNKESYKVYKCNQDGKTEICANNIHGFLVACQLKENKKRTQLDSDSLDEEGDYPTSRRKKSRTKS